jgi:hypothetical protein
MEKTKVDKWIDECDVDGRGIKFEFFDSDIYELKIAIEKDNEKVIKTIELLASWFAENDNLPDEEWGRILKESGLDNETE